MQIVESVQKPRTSFSRGTIILCGFEVKQPKPKVVAMKIRGSEVKNPVTMLALAMAGLSIVALQSHAASYEWTFNGGDLSTSLGSGTMAYTDAETAGLTTFGTTGGGVPNIGGNVASFIHVPVLPNIGNGYHLTFNNTGPNGGGAYVNQYTLIYDLLSPGTPNWTALFNTNPGNPSGNDADFYLAPDRSVGIGSVYSSAGLIASDTWYRIAFVADFSAGTMTYYVNGTQVATGSQGGSGLDGRWSLLSNLDAGADLLLFNEGDTSGNYTHELYINSVAFVDSAMTGAQVSALGGPNAAGILVVPEPSAISIAILGLLAGGAVRKRGVQ
jgi:hypothetical protein